MAKSNSCEKHVMKVFEEATKDCEDKVLKEMFDSIRNYDALNNYAFSLFDTLANQNSIEEARELFKPTNEFGVLPDVAVFTIVIWVYANAGNINAALKVYQHMLASGVTPTSFSYALVIRALATNPYCDVECAAYAKKCFLDMLDRGMKPHEASYMNVLKVIACCESMEKLKEFSQQIQAKGFVPHPNVPSFGEANLTEEIIQINALKLSDDFNKKITNKEMRSVFHKWRNPHFKKEMEMMLYALIEDGNVSLVRELREQHCKTSIFPTVLFHTCVIEEFLKAGKTEGALEAYRGMLASGVAPNSYTYQVLIKGLTTDPHFVQDAKKCLLEMMDKGMRPNAATYTAVIEGFARKEDKEAEEEGKQLVEVMMGKGFEPNVKAMMEVLKGRPEGVIRRVISIVLSKLKG